MLSKGTSPFILPNYIESDEHTVEFRAISLRDAQRIRLPDGRPPDVYAMTRNPRGHALLINNVNFEDYPTRKGSEHDVHAMRELLKLLYFDVSVYENKTRQQMYELIQDFALSRPWHQLDCSMVVLMSHGDDGASEEDTEVLGVDGLGLKVRDILALFRHDLCPFLRNKPKVFFIQACRGQLIDPGVIVGPVGGWGDEEPNSFSTTVLEGTNRTETDGRPFPVSGSSSSQSAHMLWDRSCGDTFVAFAVPPGLKANRDRFMGAWFIQTVCQVLSEHSHDKDLDDLLKICDQRIKRMINVADRNYQTLATKTIGWNKRLFFNPGLCLGQNGDVIRRPVVRNPPTSCDKDRSGGDNDMVDGQNSSKECTKKSKRNYSKLSPASSLSVSRTSLGSTEENRASGCFNRCWPC